MPSPSPQASSSVAGAVGMTTSGESESDDSEMGRLQGKDSHWVCKKWLTQAADSSILDMNKVH